MRIEFNGNIPVEDQINRYGKIKQRGRKHNHTPSSRVCEKRKASKERGIKIKTEKIAKFKSQVMKYWRGDLDHYPELKC